MKAADGYFQAKREVVDHLDGRIEVLKTSLEMAKKDGNRNAYNALMVAVNELEITRNYVRNYMLWHNEEIKN